MKLTKKLLPAVVMLLVSAIMLTTSSFAWFSMNTSVKAEGMKVTAVADQVYLQISDSETFDSTDTMVKADAINDEATLAPITIGSVTGSSFSPLAANGEGLVSSTGMTWYTNISNDPDDATATGTYVDKTAEKDGFCLVNTFYLRLNPKAGQVATDLDLNCSVKLAAAPTEDMAKSVSVLVVCGDYAQLFKDPDSTDGTLATKVGKKLTVGGFKNTDVVKEDTKNAGPVEVKVYVFFDGENANCKTTNVTATGYDVSVAFNLTKIA